MTHDPNCSCCSDQPEATELESPSEISAVLQRPDRRSLIKGGAAAGLAAALGGAILPTRVLAQEAAERIPAIGWASLAKEAPLERFEFSRPAPGNKDLLIDILYCGICHSDIHSTTDNLGFGGVWPVVPGHEMVGRVRRTGPGVTKFREGQLVGVTTYISSNQCDHGMEQYCNPVWTYGAQFNGEVTQGGYANNIVVSEDYTVAIPDGMDLARTAPLLCAGLTTSWPLRNQWGVGPGDKVGVIGLGGLGHMGVKLAVEMGAEVVVFTTTPGKVEDARRLGASDAVVWPTQEGFLPHRRSFDYLLSTVPYAYAVEQFLPLLKPGGVLSNIGLLEASSVHFAFVNALQVSLTGSVVGSIEDAQNIVNFCNERNVLPDIELIGVEQINSAYERVMNKDVRFRFVIDMSTIT